jgi:aspartate oxidase
VDAVRSLLWTSVGIIRNGKENCEALWRLNSFLLECPSTHSSQVYEARNILEVGRIITQCALARQESRGAHYRSDFPLKDEASPAKHSFACKDAAVFFA